MNIKDLKRANLPDTPGVYQFIGKKGEILYVGEATSLRSRVRSYFSAVVEKRGKHIEQMVNDAKSVRTISVDSVLEAIILEAALIKRYHPRYNTIQKDNKSFNFVALTKEPYPKVIILRGRTLFLGKSANGEKFQNIFGPFPSATKLNIVLQIIRKIFPFRDTCKPDATRPCFNRQIGLCPGVCTGEISEKEYKKNIKNITLFFEGKKKRLLSVLQKEMNMAANAFDFEKAKTLKRQIFALEHINDALLVREEIRGASRMASQHQEERSHRIEAYDIAHIQGTSTVGAMVAIVDGEPLKSDYRKFRIRGRGEGEIHDLENLKEILTRRLSHVEWPLPDLIVVDGNRLQQKAAESVLEKFGLSSIPVVAVVKDERHHPRAVLGDPHLRRRYEKEILLGNSEAHRFAVRYHRLLRDRMPR